jgi:hypothetical protein
VLQLCRYRGYLRQWIAASTGFVLAVHLIVSAAIIAHFAPSNTDPTIGPYAICHGAGDSSPADPDGPLKRSPDQLHCVLCTLTNDTCAVVPCVNAIAVLDASKFLQRVIVGNSQIVHFVSLAAEYPRGPPTQPHVAG